MFKISNIRFLTERVIYFVFLPPFCEFGIRSASQDLNFDL